MINIPKIGSVEKAVEIYYGSPIIGSDEIKELFPSASRATIWKLKKIAAEAMEKAGAMRYSEKTVSVVFAFPAWGLDIDALEKSLLKLQRLGFIKKKEA